MSDDLITYELHDSHIGIITLNNPPLNLITHELNRELEAALSSVDNDPSVRALILRGAGTRSFSAGSDARIFPTLQTTVGLVAGKLAHENVVYDKVAELGIPTIAVLNGIAMGGGLELSLCCDFRVASADARIALPEVRLGMLPGSGALHRLPRIVGESYAKEMMLLGGEITAAEAHAKSLVNRISPAAELMDTAISLASQLAGLPQGAVARIKKAVHVARFTSADAMTELTLSYSEEVFRSDDAHEGLQAFFAKREPEFNR